jgi:hypothetical protein
MTPQKLDPKDASEKLTVTLSFVAGLLTGETITSPFSVACSCLLGFDAAPSALLSGAATIDLVNGLILQSVDGGTKVVDYLISANAMTTTGRRLTVDAILPVR